MIEHTQYLHIKKLKGKAIVITAAKHNLRALQAELGSDSHIDSDRSELNQILRGRDTPDGIATMAQSLMDAANIKKLRKDAVRALEVLVSLPPTSNINHKLFFYDSVQWVEQYFNVPIISAIIHNDESAPHCHILILPLVNGGMVGSDLIGYKSKLQAMQEDFYSKVGQRHGLSRKAPRKRHSLNLRRLAIDMAFKSLQTNGSIADSVLAVLVTPHIQNPDPLMFAMGLIMPEPKSKNSFVGIMTKPCKQEKPIGFGESKPIGFDNGIEPEKEQTLSCVGIEKALPTIEVSDAVQSTEQTDQIEVDYERVHDDEISAQFWHDGEPW